MHRGTNAYASIRRLCMGFKKQTLNDNAWDAKGQAGDSLTLNYLGWTPWMWGFFFVCPKRCTTWQIGNNFDWGLWIVGFCCVALWETFKDHSLETKEDSSHVRNLKWQSQWGHWRGPLANYQSSSSDSCGTHKTWRECFPSPLNLFHISWNEPIGSLWKRKVHSKKINWGWLVRFFLFLIEGAD